MRWNHPAVRDLYWAINSDDLLPTADLTPWQDHSDPFIGLLDQLDHDPTPLLSGLATRHPQHRSPRLGHYFESLWQFYLEKHPHFDLLGHNLAIRTAHQHTLGELDLVVLDKQRERVMHIELAVKFYLGLRRWPQPREHSDDHLATLIGPGLKDRCIDKYRHTQHHQLPLSLTQEAIALGLHIEERHAIFKGRLFQPGPSQHSQQHFWLARQHLQQLSQEHRYGLLERQDWFAEKPPQAGLTLTELDAQLPAMITEAIQVAQLHATHGNEQCRFFLVPDYWESKALAAINSRPGV